ncbi:hypothetical protein ONS95_005538 [Cadophora gregata]|uniref:uncharacterized protein n=1 Tax=Cadophora gregata TaxID=51156 RepID=UPI0026DB14AF|nr:uncharacterized protein ONS95_005538 [Cadophora gregata]KAK0103517.1 hypothetical protein ONS95_005538 [Cadophora gregata]KAK0107710.1 hypothetical protein ONS96_003510 [Cadophora gregata f. sp. sojae]
MDISCVPIILFLVSQFLFYVCFDFGLIGKVKESKRKVSQECITRKVFFLGHKDALTALLELGYEGMPIHFYVNMQALCLTLLTCQDTATARHLSTPDAQKKSRAFFTLKLLIDCASQY